MKSSDVAAVVVLAAMCAGPAATAEPIPASAFGRIPAVQQAAMSPNGQRIAILGGAAQERSLAIATVDQPGLPRLLLGDIETVDINWTGDDFVLARMAFWSTPTPRGASYRLERNIAVNTQAQAVSRLLQSDELSGLLTEHPIVGVVPGPPARALMVGLQESMGQEGFADLHIKRKGGSGVVNTLVSVDPATGKGQTVERGDFDTYRWDVDASGTARVRLGINELNHVFSVAGRAKGASQWKVIFSSQDRDAPRAYLGYSDRDDAALVAFDSPAGAQLTRIRLADGQRTPLGAPVAGGAFNVIFDPHGSGPVAISSEDERPALEWLDPELGQVHAALEKAFKGQAVHLEDWSHDRQRFLVRTASPDAPGAWYLFDRGRRELSPLGEEYPELKGAPLGQTHWLRYKARDGLEIPAYVTLPPGGGRGLPLIVLPHGGPSSRDHFEFDYLTQFLAARGYAVLRPQFRGSWGFGAAFETAGHQEWGGKVQTDLLDGVAELARDGVIDPKRVCIVGASFGGYSALAGAALHPEAYRCAASIDGMSDLGLMIVEDSRLYGRDSDSVEALRRDVGGARSDLLIAQSPLRQVEAIRAPVLLVHADRDTVVPIEQSQLLAEALRKAGKSVEMVTLVEDNHYLMKSANRTRMLEALDAFLAKNLPVKPAT